MSGIPRRRLLAVTGVGLAGAVAGCSSSDDETGDEENGDEDDVPEEETGSSTEVDDSISGKITVDNLDDTTHTIDLLVERDGTFEDWETESLEAGSSITLERSWPSDSEQFRVTTRLNEGEPVDITPSNWNDSTCLNIFVRITGDDSMTHSSNTSDVSCAGDDDSDDGDD